MSAEAQHFWRGRRVLLTGHTGFKGAWTALWLERAGAEVTGFALDPDSESLYQCLCPWRRVESITADLRDRQAVRRAVAASNAEVIIHMAAQALVRQSYREPVETFATNVMGTVHLLDAAERCPNLRAVLVVTSDKVYDNHDAGRPFREGDPLAGDDPYSASKAAAEQVARCWRSSFLQEPGSPTLGVARAGNVIGGGDWGRDRLVPDVIRAGAAGKPVTLRYPNATRPWQHVLDVITGYLAYAQRLATQPPTSPTALNFGPSHPGIRAFEVVEALQKQLGWTTGWKLVESQPLPEKAHINLDAAQAQNELGWHPRLPVDAALEWVARWHRAHLAGENMRDVSLRQIADYEALAASGDRS